MLDLAPIEQNIAMQAMRSGQPLPDRIANAPVLIIGLEFYLMAFFNLDSERDNSMSLRRIPWSAVDRYAIRYELDDEQYDDLHYFIKELDTKHLERLKKKQQTK